MGSAARFDREQLRRFNRRWETLYETFPESKRAAVEVMGRAAQNELKTQILAQDVDDGFGHVRSWQEVRLGSRGGYAALSPGKRTPAAGSGREYTRAGRSGLNKATGTRFVPGHLCYSWTKLHAQELALDAAEKLLRRLAALKG